MAHATDGSAVSLEDWVGSALDGQFAASPADDETDAQPTSESEIAPGAPPVEPAPDSDDNHPAPEGEDEDTAPEAAADPNAPDSAPPSATPDDDPLATAQPFTYTVNGQSRGFEDITVLPGYGAIIPDTALPKLQQRLSERDTLFEKSQQQYQQYTDLERLTAWKTTGPDGKEQTLTGAQALEARQMALEKHAAILHTITEAFDNPALFRSLIMVDQQGNIVPDPTALQALTTRAELAAVRAERTVQQQYQGLRVASPQQATPQAPQIDMAAAAPTLVEYTATQLGLTTLTAEDKTFLQGMLPQFVRTATPEDVALSPTPLQVGEPVLDARFQHLVQQQASLRATSAKTVQVASTVSKENAARLAAAQAGKTPVQAHLRNAPTRQPPKVNQRAQDADDAFTLMESLAAGRFPSTAGA